MLDHLGLAVSDIERSRAFYERALAPLGIHKTMEVGPDETESGGTAMAFGRGEDAVFWIADKERPGEGAHVAFTAKSRADVDALYNAALEAGGCDHGEPGLRPNYGPNHYAAFVYVPDGINVEAVCYAAE